MINWLKKHEQKKQKKTKTGKTVSSILEGNHKKESPSVIRISTSIVRGAFKGIKKTFKILLYPLINPWMRHVLLAILVVAIGGLIFILKDLPSPRKIVDNATFAVSSQIFDRNGELLYEIFGDENRTPILLQDLPPYVYQASIAIEDQNFYKHFGFDIYGIIRALHANIQGDRLEGGSTITQQLVKNALLSKEKTLQRKTKEGILAVFTEILYTKEEILEMYINYISYGGTSVGIESASQKYFDKHAKDLSLGEASLLAGLPQAPSRYSPFGSNPEEAKARQSDVLRRMTEDGYISDLQAEAARAEILQYALSTTDIKAPHFVFYVKDLLIEKYGQEMVERGGLRVTTTLDLQTQNVAQASLSAEIKTLENSRVGNGAALVIKPNTGEILAMIGSKDYFNATESGQVNVTLSQRQPGSSIKPILYAATFQEKLLNPGSILIDAPTCFTSPGQQPYCPKNYNGSFNGPVTVRAALATSLNIPAVKALRVLGVERFMSIATRMGITSWTDASRYGLSLSLGGGEVRMIDLAQAFSVLAAEGVKVPITPILEIKDYKGNVIEKIDIEQRKADLDYLQEFQYDESAGDLKRVLDREPAYLVSHIMQDNKARTPTFGARSQLVIPNQIVSAKTGTTNNLKDNWTVGFTPEFLVITWVGNNDGTAMNQRVVSGITGAAPIFNDIMSYILNGREPVWQEKPYNVASENVCATGMPAQLGGSCMSRGKELYWTKSLPSLSNARREDIFIDPNTGQPPPEGVTVDGLVVQQRTVYSDPITESFCPECAQQTIDEQGKPVMQRNEVRSDYVINSADSEFEFDSEFDDSPDAPFGE